MPPWRFASLTLEAACRDMIAEEIHRGNSMLGRQCDNSVPMAEQARARTPHQRASPTLDERCKCGLHFTVAADIEDDEFLPDSQSRACSSETKGFVRGHLGSTITAMRAVPGRSSRKSPSCFAVSSTDMKLTPVTLPPGRLRLATRPSLIGSPPVTKTIGTVVVAALAASAEGVLATISAICRRRRSATRSGTLV